MPRYEKNPEFKRGRDDSGERRLDWFNALNREAMARGCWLISTPAASEVILEALPENAWPAELVGRKFPLAPEPDGQRILPHAVRTEMVLTSSGGMTPATPGSTMPTTTIYTGAGIAKTKRWKFRAPF
jgi:hypothetical protein